MKRTIEIDDTLDERVQSAIDDVKTELLSYLEENKPASVPDLGNDLDYSGAIHEIVDGSVPVYTYEVKCLWFLYGGEFEEAYENAGVGDNPMENDGMAAIYFYIQEQVNEWYADNAETIFEEWQGAQPKMKIKATITEHGNGLPSIGELCYDPNTDTVYKIVAWDGSDRISTNGPGRGNSVDVLLESRGDASDTTEEEWEAIESNNYGVTVHFGE